jgi:predicted transport protein
MFELLTTPAEETAAPRAVGRAGEGQKERYKTVTEQLAQVDEKLRDRFEALKAFLLALGDDVQMKVLSYYVAFKRFKNFACVEVRPQAGRMLVYVKVDPSTVALQENFLRDVRKIGHFGTGDLEISISSDSDLERAKTYLIQSYEAS